MSLTKIVNGETVPCSPEEEAAIRAEWAANDPAKALPSAPKRINLDDVVARLKAKNVFTQADVDAVTK